MAENLAASTRHVRQGGRPPAGRADPPEGGINVLTGSLAPLGAVVKVAGLSAEQLTFEGDARVFDGEEAAMAAIVDGSITRARCS